VTGWNSGRELESGPRAAIAVPHSLQCTTAATPLSPFNATFSFQQFTATLSECEFRDGKHTH
jgi:hypothetical protein